MRSEIVYVKVGVIYRRSRNGRSGKLLIEACMRLKLSLTIHIPYPLSHPYNDGWLPQQVVPVAVVDGD